MFFFFVFLTFYGWKSLIKHELMA